MGFLLSAETEKNYVEGLEWWSSSRIFETVEKMGAQDYVLVRNEIVSDFKKMLIDNASTNHQKSIELQSENQFSMYTLIKLKMAYQ